MVSVHARDGVSVELLAREELKRERKVMNEQKEMMNEGTTRWLCWLFSLLLRDGEENRWSESPRCR